MRIFGAWCSRYGAADAAQTSRASLINSALPLTGEPSGPQVVSSRPIRVGSPSVPACAIRGQGPGARGQQDCPNTSVQNTTGHLALSLPAGRLSNGLPFGLQVTGPRFRDHLLLDLASSWEEARLWPGRPGDTSRSMPASPGSRRASRLTQPGCPP